MMTYFRKLLTGALGLGAACLIAGGNQVLAQTWTELLPTGGPPDGRSSATAVYNSATNRMIVFGGGEFRPICSRPTIDCSAERCLGAYPCRRARRNASLDANGFGHRSQ